MKKLKAKYPGKCLKCGCRFLAGTTILWGHGNCELVTTEECEAAKALAAEVAEALAAEAAANAKPLGNGWNEVFEALEQAGQKLKWPKIIVEWKGTEIKLSIAGPKSKVPGVINVAAPKYGHGFYGRIAKGGLFTPMPGALPEHLGFILGGLGAGGKEALAEFGKTTGHCVFCNTGLEDEKSLKVGYGPVCAKNWGMPWGKKAA